MSHDNNPRFDNRAVFCLSSASNGDPAWNTCEHLELMKRRRPLRPEQSPWPAHVLVPTGANGAADKMLVDIGRLKELARNLVRRLRPLFRCHIFPRKDCSR